MSFKTGFINHIGSLFDLTSSRSLRVKKQRVGLNLEYDLSNHTIESAWFDTSFNISIKYF